MLYVVIALNCLLGIAITSAYYPVAGIAVFLFSILMLTVGYKTAFGAFFIGTQMKHWGSNIDQILLNERKLLMSVACLSLSLKVGAAIAIFVETGAVLLIAFCILIAFGYFFEGPASGMTIGLSYGIARLVVKLFSLIHIGFDRIAEWIAKAELRILKIEQQ